MLTDDERAVLDFEARYWRSAGTKEAAVRVIFGVSAVRHYQRVASLLERRDALAYAPMTIDRLRSVRDRSLRNRRGAQDGS